MSAVDLVAAAYACWGGFRGWKRGLSGEAYRLVRVVVALAAGCGLYGLVQDGLEYALQLGPDLSGPLGFVGTAGGAFAIVRLLRRKVTEWVERRVQGQAAHVWGAVAGSARALAAVLAIVSALFVSPASGVERRESSSVITRIVGFLVQRGEPEPNPEPPTPIPAP